MGAVAAHLAASESQRLEMDKESLEKGTVDPVKKMDVRIEVIERDAMTGVVGSSQSC